MPKSLFDFPRSEDLGHVLGIKITEAGPTRVVATMPIDTRHHQPLGYLHGGASVALAETAASIGAYFAAPDGQTAFGMEINANHLRPKREGTLTATAVPVYVGRSTQVWQIDIVDEDAKLVCTSRCTLAIVATDRRGDK